MDKYEAEKEKERIKERIEGMIRTDNTPRLKDKWLIKDEKRKGIG